MKVQKFQSLGVLDRLHAMHLPKVPYLQMFIARVYLGIDYAYPVPTTISVDGIEKLADSRPFLVAMNHTDRYNYAPFMRHLDQLGLPPLAPWVKGKYYQKRWLSTLLTLCACMPAPSKGFLLTLDWVARMGRDPSDIEYRQIRHLGDGEAKDEPLTPDVERYLSLAPGGGRQEFFNLFHEHFESLTRALIRVNREALELGYRPLIFPQGTRSKRLTHGFSGIIQMAIHLGVPILPVGVSGSDRLYPGNRALSKGGHVHYSVGNFYDPALEPQAPKNFIPLTFAATHEYGDVFTELTSHLMDRINLLLPKEYRYDPEGKETTRQGTRRFL